MATKKIVLCDTNIFIDYFHGDERINQELDFLGFENSIYCILIKTSLNCLFSLCWVTRIWVWLYPMP